MNILVGVVGENREALQDIANHLLVIDRQMINVLLENERLRASGNAQNGNFVGREATKGKSAWDKPPSPERPMTLAKILKSHREPKASPEAKAAEKEKQRIEKIRNAKHRSERGGQRARCKRKEEGVREEGTYSGENLQIGMQGEGCF